jgi:hypothetical protein
MQEIPGWKQFTQTLEAVKASRGQWSNSLYNYKTHTDGLKKL